MQLPNTLELLAATVEQAPDAIIFADREGLIRAWNHAAQRLFGYTAGEAIGQSLDLIIPDRLRRAHWDGFHRAIATGTTKYASRALITRSAHKDGRKLYVDLSFSLLRDAAGSVIGAVAIGRDGTERHAVEGALRERISALEQRVASGSRSP
jgi:PAS domain S-box-containing protein